MEFCETNNSNCQYSNGLTQQHNYQNTRKYLNVSNSLELFKQIQNYKKLLLEKNTLINKYHDILSSKIQRKSIKRSKRRKYLNNQKELVQLKSDILEVLTNLEYNNEQKLCALKYMCEIIDYKLFNMQLQNNKQKIVWY